MIYAIIALVVVAIITFAVTWRFVLPRLVDKSVSAVIHAFYEQEVRPMQEALETYPPAFERMQDEIDYLYSTGQQKPRESFDKIDELPIRAANPKV